MAHISPCECSSDSNVFEPMILFVHCWYIVWAARQKEGNSWNSRTPNPSNLGDPGAWHTAQPAGISWNAKRSKSRSRSPPKTDTNIIKPEVCCWHLLTHPKKSQDTTVGDQGMILGIEAQPYPTYIPACFKGQCVDQRWYDVVFLVKTLLITAGISASSCSYNWICLKLWFHKWMVSHHSP